MIKIEFSEEEYGNLVRLVYFGNWLVNGVREAPVRKYQQLKRYIFSFALKTKSARLVSFSREYGEFVPSPELENDAEVKKFIDNYDEETFWEELARRLSKRDLEKEYGLRLSAMDKKEISEKEYLLVDKYSREFARHGIGNLHLQVNGNSGPRSTLDYRHGTARVWRAGSSGQARGR